MLYIQVLFWPMMIKVPVTAPTKCADQKVSKSCTLKELVCQEWKLSKIKGYIGISGPYHLPKLREHLFDRGIEQLSFLTKIVGGESSSMLTDAEHEEALTWHECTLY